MALFTPEQAQTLLDQGMISQGTYNSIVGSQEPVTADPSFVAPEPIITREPVLPEIKIPKVTVDVPNPIMVGQRQTSTGDLVGTAPTPSQVAETENREIRSALDSVGGEAIASAAPRAQPEAAYNNMREPMVAEFERLAQIGQKQAQLGYEEGQRQAGILKGVEEQQLKYNERAIQLQQERQKATEEGLKKVREAEEAASKLEPKDYWADRSTGAKIGAAIAMAMGAYASAYTGGPNQAMQVIDNAIARDLALQKEKYIRAKDRGVSARSLLADNIAILKDQEAAELATMGNMLNVARTRIEAFNAKTRSQESALNGQRAAAELSIKQQELNQKLLERMAQVEMSKRLQSGQQVNPEMLDEKQRARYIDDPEFGGLARTEQAANKVSETLVEYRAAKDLLSTLNEISKTPGKSLSPKLIARAETAAAALKGKLRGPVVGPGAVSESEWKLLDNIVSNPTDFFRLDNSTKQRLQGIDNLLDSNMANTAKAYGIRPRLQATESNSVLVQTPNGQTVKIPRANLQEAQKRVRGLRLL